MLQILEEDLKKLLENSESPCQICTPNSKLDCSYCEGGHFYNYDEVKWLEIVKKYTI